MRELRSKAHIEKKRKKRRKLFLLLPIAFILVLALFLYYAFSPRFHVTNVIVTGSSFAKPDTISTFVHEKLSSKFWHIIPRRSPFLVSKKYLENILYTQFPSIKNLRLDIDKNALYVNIVERNAIAVICNPLNECFFLDETGYAFAQAPRFEGSSFIKIESYDVGVAPGVQTMSQEELDKIAKSIELFRSVSVTILHISITSESEMRLVDSHSTEFIVNRVDSLPIIEERLRAIMRTRPDIIEGKYEYIDLRIESKIFLKRKES